MTRSQRIIRKPDTISDFSKLWPRWKAFLQANGAEILTPTNQYEVARFTTLNGVGVVYINGAGRITSWVGGAEEAFEAFKSGQPWAAVHRVNRKSKKNLRYEALVERDGNGCFYCGKPLGVEEATVEHLIPIATGGTNHQGNLALACFLCNSAAGTLPVRAKLEMAIFKRGLPRVECAFIPVVPPSHPLAGTPGVQVDKKLNPEMRINPVMMRDQ